MSLASLQIMITILERYSFFFPTKLYEIMGAIVKGGK